MAKVSPKSRKGNPASKKSKPKKAGAVKEKKSRSETYVLCPYTEQKVWISKATVSDLKPKKGKQSGSSIHSGSSHKKQLWTISSSQIRQDHYVDVAQALSIYEQALLPSSGGRSWEVSVKLSEPSARVLFRSWKGQMELACLPHLIDRIPSPPVWPGKRNQPADDYQAMQGEEEECTYNNKGRKKNTKQDYINGLMTREISMLSQVAWDVLKPKYDHPAPTVTIKWKSPDAKTFTSRKTAWEYATELSKQEVAIERNLKGVGASGKLLKEFFPSAKTAIEVGKLRFVRDGLWVVGQESSWQDDREEELLAQEEELEEAASSKVYTSGLQLYVAENRHQYRDENGTNLTQADKALRHNWRCLTPKEQDVWNDKVREQFEDSSVEESDSEEENEGSEGDDESDESSVEYISHYQYFVQQRRHDYRHEQQMKLEANEGNAKKKFTLAQADKELRQQWKEMSEQEQDDWIEKLEQMDKETSEEEEKEKTTEIQGEEGKRKEVVMGNENSDTREISESNLTTSKSSQAINNEESVSEKANITHENHDTIPVPPKETPGNDGIKQQKECKNAQDPDSGLGVDGGKLAKAEHGNGVDFEEEKKSEESETDMKVQSTSSATTQTVPESFQPTAEIPIVTKSSVATEVRSKSSRSNKNSKRKSTKNNSTTTTTKQAKKRSTKKTTPKYCLKPDQINQCFEACMDHYDTVMRTVKTRDLARELADGFDVLRERGHGRFDMEIPAFDTPEFGFLNSFEKTPWMPIVRAILGDDVVLIHKGSFMSLPGAGAQVYHQDGVHLTTQTQRPCHAINVFVPLVDLHSRNGPTEFVLGSHVLGHDGYDRDFLETPKPKAGTPVIFDYRLGHRGLANSSPHCRPIVYCTYARAADGKEFRDSVNFSRKRYHKIGELSAKPLSREERRNKRKRSIETALEKEEIEKVAKVSAKDDPPKAVSTDDAGTSEDISMVKGVPQAQGGGDAETMPMIQEKNNIAEKIETIEDMSNEGEKNTETDNTVSGKSDTTEKT